MSRGNSFKCMIKGTNLTNLYTQLDIPSLPPVAPIFALQSWSYYGKLPLHRWSHSAGILSTHWCYTTGVTNHTKISDSVSISLNLHLEYMITSLLNTYYFISTTIITINQNYYIKHILHIYSTIIMILRLWALPFYRLKSTPVAIGPRGPMLSSNTTPIPT